MDLENKNKEILDTTHLNEGEQITEEYTMKKTGTENDHFSQTRENEMNVSKQAADRLMENWGTERSSSRNSGSYTDREFDQTNEDETEDKKFYEMTREELIDFIFDGDPEGEEALDDNYSDEDLIEIALEKNKKIEEEPAMTESKERPAFKSFGVFSAISKLEKSPISEHSTFKIMLENYKNLLKSKGLPESLLIENFISELSNFKWDEDVNKESNSLIESLKNNAAEVEVEKAIFTIKRDAGWKFYSTASDIMNEWLNSEDKSNKVLAKNLKSWAFNPVVGNLVNKLNEMTATETGSLNIPSKQGESYVTKVYSPISLSEGNTYFFMNGKYFRADAKGVSIINENKVNEDFKNLVSAFNSEGITINENGITCYLSKDKVSIVSEGETTSVYVGKNKLSFDNKITLAKLLESKFSGIFGSQGTRMISNILSLYENFDNIVELDFVKSVKSRIYEGLLVNLIKWEDKIFVNKVNPGMNENALYASNGRHAVKTVKSLLNYDISEGLTEYLEGEQKIKSIMLNDRKKVLENIASLENEINKINVAVQNDDRLVDSDEIKSAKSMLENEINKLKKKWSTINTELDTFDSIDFDAIEVGDAETITEEEKFSIGSLVKIKESGDTGKIISIDGSSGTYTVLHDSGSTGDYQIDEIVDLAEALNKSKTTPEEAEESTEDKDDTSSEDKE